MYQANQEAAALASAMASAALRSQQRHPGRLRYAALLAARARTESRGCHRRTDVHEPSDEWLRHLTATLHNGHMEVA